MEQGKDYIFIFEDDFVWELKHEDVLSHLNSIFNYEFNILLLSYHIPVIEPNKISDIGLGFYKNCQTTSGYIVHKRFIPQLIQNFEKTILELNQNSRKDIAIDQNWKSLQTFENKFYVSVPRLGKQLPSYSDIEKKFVSYGGGCFMGILSCEKYKDRRLSQNLKECPFEYRYFIGDPELKESKEDFENKIVYLPCKDDYDFLPGKVVEMIKWINTNYPNIDYIFKTDDDIRFNFIELLKQSKELTLKNIDYAGSYVNCEEHMSDYFRKKNPKANLVKVPATKYCPGGGYFLSKKSYTIILNNLLKDKTIYEDQSVGYCLNKHNIYPININIKNRSCFW